MSIKTKKIIFSSLSAGLSLLSLILFVLPFVNGVTGYQILQILPEIFAISSETNPATIMLLLLGVCALIFIILTPILLVLSIVVLLCEIGVIKSVATTKILKKVLKFVASFQAAFTILYIVFCIAVSFMEENTPEYFAVIIFFILTIALSFIVRRVNKIDKQNPTTPAQVDQNSLTMTEGESIQNNETPVEDVKTEEVVINEENNINLDQNNENKTDQENKN